MPFATAATTMTTKLLSESTPDFNSASTVEQNTKVVFKHNDACGIKLTITIWKDLGRGPKSEEWEGHLRETCTGIILEVFPLKLNPRKERLLQALKVGCTETGYGDQTL